MNLMKYALLVCTLTVVAGCAGLDGQTQKDLMGARQALSEDPQAALDKSEAVLAKFPKNVDALAVRAEALDDLGRKSEAIEAWTVVLNVDARKSDKQLIHAHRRVVNLTIEILGPLPHGVNEAPRGTERKNIEQAQNCIDFLIDENENDLEARLHRVQCQYRLGLADSAAAELRTVLEQRPDNAWALYLQALVQEQLTGPDENSLSTLYRLSRGADSSLRVQVIEHLMFLLGSDTVSDLQRSNIRGVLVRTSRQPNAPSSLITWSKEFHETERNRLNTQHFDLQFKEIDRLLNSREYARAWNMVDALPEGHPDVETHRQKVARSWTRVLLARGTDQLRSRKLDDCRNSVNELSAIPQDLLTVTLSKQRIRLVSDLQEAESRRIVKKHLNRAEDAMRRRKEREALAHLEGIDEHATKKELREIHLIRARAMFATGDRDAALANYDKVGEVQTISDRRDYGVLLSAAGRNDEATRYLDLMPLGAMQGETLDALVESLERQGSWDKLLSRLSDMDPLPTRYKETLVNASLQAAQRNLTLRSPDRALKVLTSYLSKDQLRKMPVYPAYLAAVLRTGDHDQARSLIMRATPRQLNSLSQELVFECLDTLGESIDDEVRFELLQKVAGNVRVGSSRDAVDAKLKELAPRFGNYLPKPGDYDLEYRITRLDTEERTETRRTENLTLKWQTDRFKVESSAGPNEYWWIDQGTWYRKKATHTEMIPVKVNANSSLPRESFESQTALWVATVVESGIEVITGGDTYAGCLRVRLVPDENEDNMIIIDIAPDVGEVRREVYRDGERVRWRTLVGFEDRK